MILAVATVLGLAFSTDSAQAHEFWLAPEAWQVAPGDPLEVRLRVGQRLRGPSFVLRPDETRRFEVIHGDQVQPVTGRMGDDPALAMPAPGTGLAIVVHETEDTWLTWRAAEKFQAFLEEKDLTGIWQAHLDRGLPPQDFRESYRRHAKALIAVGDGAGADRRVGLRIEIVALDNPYTDDLSGGMGLQLWLDGQPRADARLTLFDRAPDRSVTETVYRTDAAGRVRVAVTPGHDYLADSVVIAPRDPAPPAEAVWHSDWAALGFAVPDRTETQDRP